MAPSSATPSTGSATSRPVFVDWGRPRQAWEGAGGAVVMGVVSGLLLGLAWWAYALGALVSFLGGAPAGGQHRTLPGAVARGFVGGAVWAACVFATSHVTGADPTVELPGDVLAFLPWGFVPSVAAAVVSWWVGRRRRAAL